MDSYAASQQLNLELYIYRH